MSTYNAFYRLWTRTSLLSLATSMPAMLLLLTSTGDMSFAFPLPGVFGALSQGQTLLWRETILIPASVSWAVQSMLIPLKFSPYLSTVPNLRRGITRGVAQLFAAAICLATVVHTCMHSSPLLAAGLAAVSFATFHLLVGHGKFAKWSLLALLVVGIWPSSLANLSASTTAIVGILSLCTSYAVLRRNYDPDYQRRHLEQAIAKVYDPKYMERIRRRMGRPMHPIADHKYSNNVAGWMRAAADLSINRRRWMLSLLWSVVVAVVFAYAFCSPAIIVFYLTSRTGNVGERGLPGDVVLPLHRKMRASLAFFSALFEMGLFLGVTLSIVALLFLWKPFPPALSIKQSHFGLQVAFTAIFLALLPLTRWRGAQPDLQGASARLNAITIRTITLSWATTLLVILLSAIAAYGLTLFTRPHLLLVTGVVITAAVASHTLYYRLLQRAYMRKDLA